MGDLVEKKEPPVAGGGRWWPVAEALGGLALLLPRGVSFRDGAAPSLGFLIRIMGINGSLYRP